MGQTNNDSVLSDDPSDAWIKVKDMILNVLVEESSTELTSEQEEYLEVGQGNVLARGEIVLDNIQSYARYLDKEYNNGNVRQKRGFGEYLDLITKHLRSKGMMWIQKT